MSRPRHGWGTQPGRLVATMLRALTAELSDPGRYTRGKAYARDGAVVDIDVREEVVAGLVLGTRSDPYEVLLGADPVPADELGETNLTHPATMSMLVPGRDELSVSCTCPDAPGMLCKHAVAVLLVFADETSIEPDLLVRWRTTSPERSPASPAITRLSRRGRLPGVHGAPAPPPATTARVDPLAGMLDAPGPLPDIAPVTTRVAPGPLPARVTDPLLRLIHELAAEAWGVVTRRS